MALWWKLRASQGSVSKLDSATGVATAAYRAVSEMVERLEPRVLLSLTPAQVIYNWKHAHPGFLRDLAVYEYQHPDFAARQNAALQKLGLPTITPIAPSLVSSATSSARGTHHPKPHKPAHPQPVHVKPVHSRPHHHVRGNGPMVKDSQTGPTVTVATFSYWTLPQTVTFTFSEDVSASVTAAGSGVVTVKNNSTGVDYAPTTIATNSGSQTVTLIFGSTPMPAGQYTATLKGSLITCLTPRNLWMKAA